MKKIIALLLSTVLAAGLFSSFAFADEVPEAANEELSADTEAAVESEDSVESEDAADAEDDGISPGASAGDAELRTVEVNLSENGEIEIDDYSVIEIPASAVQITDADISNYIDSMINYSITTEQITEGVAEEGDTVNIDFSGVLAGEEEPFEGGTGTGYDLTLGSGMFIPGFESQVVGHEVGETFDIDVTFPEQYTEDMAGKDATFTVTINYKSVEKVPELNDDFVKEFSASNLKEELNTVEELEEYTKNYLYDVSLKNAIMAQMQDKTHVYSYKEDQFELLKAYSLESLSYYAQMYSSMGMEGYDENMVAQSSGFADADSYTNDEAMYYMNIIMMLDKIADDYGIEITDEEVDEAVETYMASYGYDSTYTVDEFKEMSGEGWTLLITTLNVEYQKVMDELTANVVIVDDDANADETADIDEEASVDEEAADEDTNTDEESGE